MKKVTKKFLLALALILLPVGFAEIGDGGDIDVGSIPTPAHASVR